MIFRSPSPSAAVPRRLRSVAGERRQSGGESMPQRLKGSAAVGKLKSSSTAMDLRGRKSRFEDANLEADDFGEREKDLVVTVCVIGLGNLQLNCFNKLL